MAVSVMLYTVALAPLGCSLQSQFHLSIAKFFSAHSAAGYRYLNARLLGSVSDKSLDSGYTGLLFRSLKNGLRNPPGNGATQRKPVKAVLPAFDALHTFLTVTRHGSSPLSYRGS